MEENKNRIKCLLCGGFYRVITLTHLESQHGIDTYDYQELFLGEPMQCSDTIELRVAHQIGVPRDPLTCQKISDSNIRTKGRQAQLRSL